MTLIYKQLAIDFHCSPETIALPDSFFTTYKGTSDSRYPARNEGNLVCQNGRLLCRTTNVALTQELREKYASVKAEWFCEMSNLYALNQILSKYDLEIQSIVPFFIPDGQVIDDIAKENYQFHSEKEIPAFKNDKRIRQSFCYSEDDPDKLGLSYTENGKLLAMGGANHQGKYTWEIGIERIEDGGPKYLASKLVRKLVAKIQTDYPDVLPIYSTQFSHVQSINVAIHAGLKLGWTEIIIGKKN
jgi:hypothetical protein